jgi:hypothetical protein
VTHEPREQLHLALAPASWNVAELAHLIGCRRQPVCGIRGRRLDEQKRRSARSPIGHWHDTPRWLVTMSCQIHSCIKPGCRLGIEVGDRAEPRCPGRARAPYQSLGMVGMAIPDGAKPVYPVGVSHDRLYWERSGSGGVAKGSDQCSHSPAQRLRRPYPLSEQLI